MKWIIVLIAVSTGQPTIELTTFKTFIDCDRMVKKLNKKRDMNSSYFRCDPHFGK